MCGLLMCECADFFFCDTNILIILAFATGLFARAIVNFNHGGHRGGTEKEIEDF